jgi:uncharacterized membrane protein
MNLSIQDGITLLVYSGIGGILFGFFAVLVFGVMVNIIAIIKKVF